MSDSVENEETTVAPVAVEPETSEAPATEEKPKKKRKAPNSDKSPEERAKALQEGKEKSFNNFNDKLKETYNLEFAGVIDEEGIIHSFVGKTPSGQPVEVQTYKGYQKFGVFLETPFEGHQTKTSMVDEEVSDPDSGEKVTKKSRKKVADKDEKGRYRAYKRRSEFDEFFATL